MPLPRLDPALPEDVTGWDRLRRPVWLFDPVSCHGLYANASALELWGAASLDELLGRDFSKLSPAVRTRVERLARATVSGEAISERWTFYPNGTPLTVQAVITSLVLEDGRAVLLFEAAPVDVEEDERRAVEALRHSSSLITLFDPEGRALFCNPAAFATYGSGDRGFVERFADPNYGAALLAQVQAGAVLAELCQVLTEAGERSHHLDARQVQDPVTGAVGVLLSERDVTAQVEAELALVAEHERAEVAVAKERFLANMSHELRTPLTSVLGFAGLLAGSALDPSQTRHVERISRSGEALLSIINDVIAISELESGEVSLDAAAFDTSGLLEDALIAIEPQALAKGLALRLEIAADVPDRVVGDAARLSGVLHHFLSNAVKFTDQGEIVLRLETIAAGEALAGLRFSVLDTGPGLDASAQARLFQRFTQGDDSRRKRFAGSGLGLAISREIALLMDGDVGVESAPGQGSCFWLQVSLPLDGDVAETGDEPGETVALSILYADDHESNRALVQAILAAHGHRCDTVCDGAQAVAAVQAQAYDLVLMDIQMPVQDGVAATHAIRALHGSAADLPILALTANTLSEQRAAYAAAGMNDCVAKPVNVAELIAKVSRWGSIGSRAASQPLAERA